MSPDESLEERLARLEERAAQAGSQPMPRYWGYEYRSKLQFFGLPLLHVAGGTDPRTGRFLVAKGIIAVGQVAIGILSIGGVSIGVFAFGGLAIGLAAFGGLALAAFLAVGGVAISGYVAAGGLAVAGYVAFGGMAVSWNYAFGGMAIGAHPYGENFQDPAALEFLRSLLPDWKW